MANYRTESDSMGEIQVESNKYWGAQTQRSLVHFSIGKDLIPIQVVHALTLLKKAAAISNNELGVLDGSKTPIHPNDHVNMSQSSNDTFPTAMCIATALELNNNLLPTLVKLSASFWEKAKSWDNIVKIGRTHMQDAVPMTLGQEFSGYAIMIDDNILRIKMMLPDVYKLAVGGTAIGTGINTHKDFAITIAKHIGILTKLPFITAPNKFAVQGSHDALVSMSGMLRTLANSLYKIANDIRILSCGPRAGIHELILPEK